LVCKIFELKIHVLFYWLLCCSSAQLKVSLRQLSTSGLVCFDVVRNWLFSSPAFSLTS